MKFENFLYAVIGAAIVALAWSASIFLTLPSITVTLGFLAVAAVGALAIADYGIGFKKSAR